MSTDFINDLEQEKNAKTLRANPWLFVKVALFAFVLGAGVTAWMMTHRTDALKEQIAALKEQIAAIEQRRSKSEEDARRNAALADQYRERFLAVTKTNTSLSVFSHEDLQDYALAMLRSLTASMAKQREVSYKTVLATNKGFFAQSDAETDFRAKFRDEYRTRFMQDLVILRTEILSRIPKQDPNFFNDITYDGHWAGPDPIGELFRDFERIAKLLPVSKEQTKRRQAEGN